MFLGFAICISVASAVESVSYEQGPGDLVSITHDKNVNLTGCSAMVISLETCGETYFFMSSVHGTSDPYYTITLPAKGKTEYKLNFGAEHLSSGTANISMCGTEHWFWTSWEHRMITFGWGLQVGPNEILRSTLDVDPITFSGMKTLSHASISVETRKCVSETTTTTATTTTTTTMIPTTTSSATTAKCKAGGTECQNGGTCDTTQTPAVCKCVSGFTGDTCETAKSSLGTLNEQSADEGERLAVGDEDWTIGSGANVTEVDFGNTTDVAPMDSGCTPVDVVIGLLLVTTLALLM